MQLHPIIFIVKFVGLSSLRKSGCVKIDILIKMIPSVFCFSVI